MVDAFDGGRAGLSTLVEITILLGFVGRKVRILQRIVKEVIRG